MPSDLTAGTTFWALTWPFGNLAPRSGRWYRGATCSSLTGITVSHIVKARSYYARASSSALCRRKRSKALQKIAGGGTCGKTTNPRRYLVSSHLVESRDELLWVVVKVARCFHSRRTLNEATINDLLSSLSVSVYVLQETQGTDLQWVKSDSSSLSNRLLFLGETTSFCRDARRFAISSTGCAYFVHSSRVYSGRWSSLRHTGRHVFKYSFIEDIAELVEELPDESVDQGCSRWITPQATIASTEVISPTRAISFFI